MSTKVLVFESDAAFAGELRNELGKLGCTTSVVDDGNVGLQQAVAEKPDLILLSIELPRMNGFSVCNKLKKDPHLKDVPLIIMSSESSDETFEQHKKLRTRAEDYVHKPIAFGELRSTSSRSCRSRGGSGATGRSSSRTRFSIGAPRWKTRGRRSPGGRRPSVARPQHSGQAPSSTAARTVDADIDAFTDAAFGMLEGTTTRRASSPSTATAAARARTRRLIPRARRGLPRAGPPADSRGGKAERPGDARDAPDDRAAARTRRARAAQGGSGAREGGARAQARRGQRGSRRPERGRASA